jgi:hypothetical protein
MAAGQGFKTFVTGEVLTAGDVNGYLMQGINVFASTAARDAAITVPAEGQFAFTKDTNGLWYYDGAAWVASGATGDIEGVTAGVGISGGGTSGTVTVTNSMATAIDAKGDLVPGTGADTFARLAVGANDTVLTADSSTATGLKWAAASGGGMTLISTTSFSGTTTTLSSIPQTYNSLFLIISGVSTTAGSDTYFDCAPNNVSNLCNQCGIDGSSIANSADTKIPWSWGGTVYRLSSNSVWTLQIDNYTSSTTFKPFQFYGNIQNEVASRKSVIGSGAFRSNTEITSLVFARDGQTMNGGTVLLYGVK